MQPISSIHCDASLHYTQSGRRADTAGILLLFHVILVKKSLSFSSLGNNSHVFFEPTRSMTETTTGGTQSNLELLDGDLVEQVTRLWADAKHKICVFTCPST